MRVGKEAKAPSANRVKNSNLPSFYQENKTLIKHRARTSISLDTAVLLL